MRLGSVNFEKRGKVAIITLDEPSKLNALSAGIRQGVLESLARIEADDEIRVGIITGNGDKAFCAGADISGISLEAEGVQKFLREVLDVVHTPNVALETNTHNAPGVIRPVGDDNFVHVIMPMHLG